MRVRTKKFIALLIAVVGMNLSGLAYADEGTNGVASLDAQPLEIATVVASPSDYEDKTISVEGKVADFRHWSLFTPGVYTVFKLVDSQGNAMSVYTKGKHDIHKGDRLRVSGEYSKKKSFFIFKFKNVVKVEDFVVLSNGYSNGSSHSDYDETGSVSCARDPWVLSTC